MVLALTESVQNGLLDKDMATALLAGIMAATDRFTAPSTTAKSMTVAAQMLAAGADQQKVTKEIFGERPRREDRPKPQQQQSKPAPKPVEKVEAPKPIEEPEVDVDQELDAFIHEGANNDPLTWEAPADDNVINYRP